MEFRGIEYQVAQMDRARGNTRRDWKWSIRLTQYSSASGTEGNEPNAINAAERAINRALGPKEPKPKSVPRRD